MVSRVEVSGSYCLDINASTNTRGPGIRSQSLSGREMCVVSVRPPSVWKAQVSR